MSPRDGQNRTAHLSDLLDEYFRVTEGGETPDLKQLCRGDVELERELRQLVDEARALDGLASQIRGDRHAPIEDPIVEQVIDDKYRVEELIGRGGMGSVYAATHESLNRPVALKFLGELRLGRETSLQRFDREARALGKLRHEHIVSVLDHGKWLNRPYLVLERLDGIDLQRWLFEAAVRESDGQTSFRGDDMRQFVEAETAQSAHGKLWQGSYFDVVARIVRQVALALQSAHEHGVVHRDVKPSNIVIVRSGRAYLTDFGLASLSEDDAASLESGPLGTPRYMAPEQIKRTPVRQAPSVDVYGLGTTLYHLLTFRFPFDGNPVEILAKIRSDLPRRPRQLQPGLPHDLEAICMRAMEKRPEDRYPSAEAFADDLQAFLDRRPVQARPPGPFGRTLRWVRRKPARAALIGLGLTALILSSVALWSEGRRAQAKHELEQQQQRAYAEKRLRELRRSLPALLTLEPRPDSGFIRAVRPEPEVRAMLDEIVTLDQNDLFARFYRANFLSHHGDLAGARADFDTLQRHGWDTPALHHYRRVVLQPDEDARRLLPRIEELPAPKHTMDHVLRAYAAMRWRVPAAACKELDTAFAAMPTAWAVRDLRSIPAMSSGQYAKALSDAFAVEGALGTETARTRHVIGACLYFTGGHDEAEAAIRKSIELREDGHAPHNNLGVLLARRGKFDEAQRAFERALELRPEVWNTRAHLCRLHRERGRFQEALDMLGPAYRDTTPGIAPRVRNEHAVTLMAWGYALREEGREADAKTRFAEARKLLQETLASEDATQGIKLKAQVNRILLDGWSGETEIDRQIEDQIDTLSYYFQLQADMPRTRRRTSTTPSCT